MTTDTVLKGASRLVPLSTGTVTLTGIAKGSGMIHPDMATMLAFVGTDARIEAGLLQGLLQHAAERSFNAITVDGDTSTNDALVCMASGASGVEVASAADRDAFAAALDALCLLVRDAAGQVLQALRKVAQLRRGSLLSGLVVSGLSHVTDLQANGARAQEFSPSKAGAP
jgi:glutamate N-acetyltransferase/amino-acid N-acetyltransferase